MIKIISYYFDEELEVFVITRDNEVVFTTGDEQELFQVLDDLLA
ncbi:hypothetical protein FUSPEROL_02197 [Fusobacterium periodonticum ATCC 33693]|uniref:Uncharacterized protein n=1 Tax=Fusobacterium periodonticum ATCC 33693 TaxID=546275 RepID=D4CXU0_9FUSO|nr:hypothetical protein FUSPEROL_02197 [Fusobacterium periodonticum ATCC 33693]